MKTFKSGEVAKVEVSGKKIIGVVIDPCHYKVGVYNILVEGQYPLFSQHVDYMESLGLNVFDFIRERIKNG